VHLCNSNIFFPNEDFPRPQEHSFHMPFPRTHIKLFGSLRNCNTLLCLSIKIRAFDAILLLSP
jgi:hypothetical protein